MNSNLVAEEAEMAGVGVSTNCRIIDFPFIDTVNQHLRLRQPRKSSIQLGNVQSGAEIPVQSRRGLAARCAPPCASVGASATA